MRAPLHYEYVTRLYRQGTEVEMRPNLVAELGCSGRLRTLYVSQEGTRALARAGLLCDVCSVPFVGERASPTDGVRKKIAPRSRKR